MDQSLPQSQPSTLPSQEEQINNQKPPSKLILALFGSLLFILLVGLFLIQKDDAQPIKNIKSTIKSVVIKPTIPPEPTPYPFSELTIPYLRKQTYESQLAQREQVGETESYTSYVTSYQSHGITINGLLTQPKGEMPEGGWPAIVFVHGYIPPKNYSTLGQPYSTYVDYLARNGFVVFKIDLRGHGNSEGEPGGAYYSSDYIVDTLSAYNALQAADFVNPEKIGLWGHSMAGNISLRAFATKPDIPAVVIWGGAGFSYIDLDKYRITDASFDPSQSSANRMRKREQIRKLYGQADLTKPFWKELAPTSYLNELKGSIQLHHAVDDAVVNIAYSRDLAAQLKSTAVDYELYEYKNGGHNISGISFDTAMQRTVEFFQKHL